MNDTQTTARTWGQLPIGTLVAFHEFSLVHGEVEAVYRVIGPAAGGTLTLLHSTSGQAWTRREAADREVYGRVVE